MSRYIDLDEEAIPFKGFKFTDYSGDVYVIESQRYAHEISVSNKHTGFNFKMKAQDALKLSEALKRMVKTLSDEDEDDF